MKSVLISIQPKWVEKIASGEKTIEVRKNKPKLETPFKVYIYCTKDKYDVSTVGADKPIIWHGKVIGEFVCDRIEVYTYSCWGYCDSVSEKSLAQTCLTANAFCDYGKQKTLYGWHISNLVIYDKPKDLSDFWSADKCPYASKDGCIYKYHCFRAGQTKRCGNTLKRPPQSWCYTEEQENDRVD